jgi:hypothetical protein
MEISGAHPLAGYQGIFSGYLHRVTARAPRFLSKPSPGSAEFLFDVEL